MKKIDDGGAAFPNDIGPMGGRYGMTLRDWFAGQALAAIISKHPPMGRPGSPENGREETSGPLASAIQKSIAFGAYEYADAMIAARKDGDA